uniref:transmembrane protein 187-like n=1 Tax=Pristiophorus japonicus TaxID=55135 RepID=UPI00398E86A8
MCESGRRAALAHVLLMYGLCVAVVASGLLDGVSTELGYRHYAERPVAWLPRFLAMPSNSLVNLGYVAVGAYWLRRRRPAAGGGGGGDWGYHKDVFAWMALGYGPVQWARVACQSQRTAALDQWLTLPIFAWVPVWAAQLPGGGGTRHPGALMAASLLSYGLALAHRLGFELALAGHVAAAVACGVAAQARLGDPASGRHLTLGLASCAGFVALKLLDRPLGDWGLLPGRLSGHFCSKVCDVLQIHHTCRFLERLARPTPGPPHRPPALM